MPKAVLSIKDRRGVKADAKQEQKPKPKTKKKDSDDDAYVAK